MVDTGWRVPGQGSQLGQPACVAAMAAGGHWAYSSCSFCLVMCEVRPESTAVHVEAFEHLPKSEIGGACESCVHHTMLRRPGPMLT